MTDRIETVKTQVTIVLNDGTEIDISLANLGEIDTVDNYITDINIKESTSAGNQNPVGVISSNNIIINLNSNDRSLIPENEESPYYGKMDNTAMIKIKLIDKDSELLGDVEFNNFYVSNWVSNISSSNPYSVTIEATDLLSIVNKNNVPNSELIENANTKSTYLGLIDSLNQNLDQKFRINYNPNDIDFSHFPTIEMTNFEADNMGTWHNILCQSTLTNIYYTRENTLKTDYLLDDNGSESVCELSDNNNILTASIDKGGLVGYSGVKVNYILNTINNSQEIVSLTGQTLEPGDNTFENIDLGNKIYKINFIIVKSNYVEICEIKSLTYNKKTASIVINNPTQENLECSIIVYGQTIKENKQFTQLYRQQNSNGEILEVTNSILPINYINSFAQGLLSLINIRGNTLSLNGFFNPRVKLGDIVHVDVENSMNTSGYFKIIELNWKIGMTIKCDAKLIRIVRG